jgi:hypothetical protein
MDGAYQIDLDRERSVADIIGEALEIYQRYTLLFVTLALGVIAPYELAVLAATGKGPLASAHRVVLGAHAGDPVLRPARTQARVTEALDSRVPASARPRLRQ